MALVIKPIMAQNMEKTMARHQISDTTALCSVYFKTKIIC